MSVELVILLHADAVELIELIDVDVFDAIAVADVAGDRDMVKAAEVDGVVCGEFDGAAEVLGELVVEAILLGALLELAHRDITALDEIRDEVETLPDIDDEEVTVDVTLTVCAPVELSQVVADFVALVEGVAKIVTLFCVENVAVGRVERVVVVESEGIDVESVEAVCVCDVPPLGDNIADTEAHTLKLCEAVRLLVGPPETVLCIETLSKSGVGEGNDENVPRSETVFE